MKYEQQITLKNGKTVILRSAVEADGKAVLENFIATHEETDCLLPYADEISIGVKDEEEFLKAEQKRMAEYEKLGIQCKYGIYTWKGDNVNVIMDDDGSISTWSGDDSKTDRVYLHIVRDKDGKATDVEAVTAREILEKMAEQDLKKADKE